MKVPFSYLDAQFADVDPYLEDLRALVRSGDFTLGTAVREFESRFSALLRAPHAIGVGTGTDALALPLKLLGIGPGDEVITTPNTFIATVGAIVQAGARPVFVDSDHGMVIDPALLAEAITPRTRAIVPVHYTGNVADMPAICAVANRHGLVVVEDACQAIMASRGGRMVGSWGAAAAFSLHPLKNLNVWGDGGVVITHDGPLAERLQRHRNHGLVNRDEVAEFGVNCRLDSLQAVIGNRLIGQAEEITRRRIAHAARYDAGLADLAPDLEVPPRDPEVRHVFHLYVVRARRRDDLLAWLNSQGVEAKVHYPVPMHLQPAARYLGYRAGQFPKAEEHARTAITLPVHQHLTEQQVEYVIAKVREFHRR